MSAVKWIYKLNTTTKYANQRESIEITIGIPDDWLIGCVQ